MYNRYIPQSDGSYRRNQMQEPVRQHVQRPPAARPPSPPPILPQPIHDEPEQLTHNLPRQHSSMGAGNFLKQLLPKGLCTEDLLIIILLILMAGEQDDDRNFALLTLALYLFM